jgi:hypothetical protein
MGTNVNGVSLYSGQLRDPPSECREAADCTEACDRAGISDWTRWANLSCHVATEPGRLKCPSAHIAIVVRITLQKRREVPELDVEQ